MSALAIADEGVRMAERSDEVGFTAEDRKILYQVEVRISRMEADVREVRSEVRDGLNRIAKLESDRVVRKDLEDLLEVIEDKQNENARIAQEIAKFDVRLGDVERIRPDVETVKKYLWMGLGAIAVLQVVLSVLLKH